jgi:hypothetical protein
MPLLALPFCERFCERPGKRSGIAGCLQRMAAMTPSPLNQITGPPLNPTSRNHKSS